MTMKTAAELIKELTSIKTLYDNHLSIFNEFATHLIKAQGDATDVKSLNITVIQKDRGITIKMLDKELVAKFSIEDNKGAITCFRVSREDRATGEPELKQTRLTGLSFAADGLADLDEPAHRGAYHLNSYSDAACIMLDWLRSLLN